MYEGWVAERWETPLSGAQRLSLLELHDDGDLVLLLADEEDPEGRVFRFCFPEPPAYRNIQEPFRLELWEAFTPELLPRTGPFLRIPASPWVEELQSREPLLQAWHPDLQHYMVCTPTDVVEVLCSAPPEIHEVED